MRIIKNNHGTISSRRVYEEERNKKNIVHILEAQNKNYNDAGDAVSGMQCQGCSVRAVMLVRKSVYLFGVLMTVNTKEEI